VCDILGTRLANEGGSVTSVDDPARLPAVDAGFELHGGQRTRVFDLLRELWAYRSLLATLSRKDFFVRYRRASFGLLWAVGQPLIQAVVLAVVFSHIVKFRVGGGHYAVFVLAGLTVWSFFLATLTAGSTSIVDGASLSSKIYFPRAVLPLAVVGSSLYGLVIGLLLLVLAALVLGPGIAPHTLLVVPGALLAAGVSAGFALVLSALHVYFRDVRYLVIAATSLLFYLTPVFYPLSVVPPTLRQLITVGPMTGAVQLLHKGAVGGDVALLVPALTGVGWIVALTGAGLVVQARWNRLFADRL